MIRLNIKSTGACCAFLFLAIPCLAQFANNDTISREALIDNVVTNFYKSISDQSRLYNGPEYNFYDPIIKGSPYFNDINNFVPGGVEYDGFAYKDVSMLYDLYKDVVAILLPNKVAKLILISERVQSFDISGHHFIHIDANMLSKPGSVSTGFYDQLYSGRTEILVKRRKTIQNTSGISGSIETYFSPATDIYVQKDGIYTSVGSQGSLLNVFKDKKKELKQYIKSNKINFRENQEQAMAMVASYYDQLTK
jgi:hypothetical protein